MKKLIVSIILIFGVNSLFAKDQVKDNYKDIEDKVLNEELCQMGFISFYKGEYAKSEKFLTKCLRVKETSYEEKQKGKFYLVWQVFKGNILNYDEKTITNYLYELSKEGSIQAQYLAGMMHLHGKGVGKDFKKSALYFRNASQSIFYNMMFPDNLQMLNTPIKTNGIKSYNKIFDMKFSINDKANIFNNLNLAFELRTNQKDLLSDYGSFIRENMIDMFKSYDYGRLVEKDSTKHVKKDIMEYLNERFKKLDFSDNVIDEVTITKFYFDI